MASANSSPSSWHTAMDIIEEQTQIVPVAAQNAALGIVGDSNDVVPAATTITGGDADQQHVAALEEYLKFLIGGSTACASIVYVGLSIVAGGQHSLGNSNRCDIGVSGPQMLLVLQNVSMGSFIFSVFFGGLSIGVFRMMKVRQATRPPHERTYTRYLKLAVGVSALHAGIGLICLMMAILAMSEIKLGVVGCGNLHWSIAALADIPFFVVLIIILAVFTFHMLIPHVFSCC